MSAQRRRGGLFVTFEGPEGSGKSTQLRLLADKLRARGHAVVETAEPGGTAIGAQIRRVLLDPANGAMTPMTELLLMFAARAQNVEERIAPALRDGAVVLSDRFTDSSAVYQGVARGLGLEPVLQLERIACRGVCPDLTIVMDIDAETGLSRARGRNAANGSLESRIDDESLAFHRRVREAWLELARREAGRIRVLDGSQPIEQLAVAVDELVAPLLAGSGKAG